MKLEKFSFRRTMTAFVLCLLVSMSSMAQIPNGYYDPASGLTGAPLKTALHDIIKGHTEYPYSSTNTDVWDILKDADRDPNNANNVLGIYSDFSMDGPAEYANGSGWNREHVWAKSRGDFGTTLGAGTDCHHLRAADISTNSARNNRNFDYATDIYIDGSGTYSGPTLSKTSSTEWTWEPPDAVKGDVARMILYMTTRYEGDTGEPDLELTETLLTNTDKTPFHAKMSTILAWHLADPVSTAEQNRNDVIYGYQNNRNPYIDHPEYVCQIFACSGGGNNVPSFTSTAVTTGTENQLYTYNVTTSDADGDAMTITGTTVPAWLTFTDNGGGSATLTGTPATGDIGNNSVVLSVTDGTDNTAQSFTINVSPVGGGGSGASDLFFSEYIEGSSNNKGLEVANFTGANVSLSGYSIFKQTNGAGSWGSELALTGTLVDGDVFVVVNTSSNAAMISVADLTSGSGYVTFNGNDALALFKNGTLIDIIGTFNNGSNYAQNVTLVRNSNIGDPNTTYTTSEWTSHPTDTFGFLGAHTFDGGSTPDTEAPSAPTGLSSSNITETSFDLSWTTSTDNVGVTGYDIYQDGVLNGSVAGTSYSVTGLTASTSYGFTVQAKDGAGNISISSTTFNVTTATPLDTEAPSVPNGLSSSNITETSFDLSWTTSTDNVGVTGYDIYQDGVLNGSVAGTSYSVTGLTASTSYGFTVQAKDGAGNISISSTTLNVTTSTPSTGTSVLISEYIEGSSFNKAIEIVNLSGTTIDLSNYSLQKQTNGAGAWETPLVLSGTLADGAVYVIAHSSLAKDGAGNISVSSTTLNVTTSTPSTGTSVLISEYIEGSSFNKAIEIVNLSGTTIDLSNYSLQKQTNGAGAWGTPLALSGSLADGAVYVIAHSSADAAILAVADLSTAATFITYNGNDAVGLFENAVLVDIVGVFDGGDTNFAADQTLVRKTSATSSNSTYTTAEWDFYATDTFIYLGGYDQDLTAPSAPGSLTASNIGETSFDLSWTASTDNVGVTGYDIYLDGVLNGSVSSTSYSVTGSQASTTYQIEVYAKDASGNQSNAASTNVTTLDPPPTGNDVITQSYFETGWDGWTDGGGDCYRYSGSRSYEGSRSIRIRDNSGTSSSMTYSSIDVSGYDQLEIEFFFYVYSMENGEDFWVRYHDGSSWNTVATYARGSGIENNNFYSATVVVDKANYSFPTNAQLRFQCDASGNNDQIYIDQVTVTGIVGSAGARFASKNNASKLTWIKENTEDIMSGFMEIYPNPAVSADLTVLMEFEEEVNLEISIFTIQGREIKYQDWKNVNGKFTHTFDVSGLKEGMYMVSFTTSEGERETKKVVIRR